MRKLLVIILVALFILNIVVGAFLFLDIQVLKAPVINVELDPVTFSPTDIVLQATVRITNPNPFDVAVENFKVISTTVDGYQIGVFTIAGGTIAANKNRVFTAQDTLEFNGHNYTRIQNRITTDIAIIVLGIIKKTIPFEMTVNASLANITNTLAAPHVHLQATLDHIASDGIHFSGTIELFNPNLFELTADDLSFTLTDENHVSLGTIQLQGGSIGPSESLIRPVNGTVLFSALNAASINATFSGIVGATAAGINKTLPVSVTAQITVPNLITLLQLNGSFAFNLTGNFKIRLRGIFCYIDFSIFNPSALPLQARDLICSIYRLDKNTTRLLGQQNMTPCTVEAKQEQCVSATIVLRYLQFFFTGTGHILPDWFVLTIKGNISLTGVNQALPIAITGYLEPHFLINTTTNPTIS